MTEKKPNRHVTIALNHMNKQRDSLNAKISTLTAERDGLDAAILALDGNPDSDAPLFSGVPLAPASNTKQ